MFTQEQLKSALNKFLDRGRGSISKEEVALELECSRDDIVKNKKKVEDTLIEVQEDKAIENCKKVLNSLLANDIEPTPESLADYLKISVRDVKYKQHVFDNALAEL
jgi:biotin operon repressor